MGLWFTPPAFAHGQVVSAAGHLNGLARSVQLLHDVWTGNQFCFRGNYTIAAGWSHVFYGAIRHYWNTLYWRIRCWDGGSAIVYYNGTAVASCSGNGTHSGTVNLSSLGLTVGGFYGVYVQGGAGFEVQDLAERLTQTYPTLASFADGTTPSAAEWQALSTYANQLRTDLYTPRPAWPATPQGENPVDATGRVYHRCRYLYYDLFIQQPYNSSNYPNPGGGKWSEMRLYVNNTALLLCRVDQDPAPTPPYNPPVIRWYQNIYGSGAYTFTGLLDLATLLPGLAYGQPYRVVVTGQASTYWDLEKKWRTNHLVELPASTPGLPGWHALPEWQHGNYITGNSGANPVQAISADLLAVRNLTTAYNPVAQAALNNGALHNVRKWRWLWYTNVKGATPKLAWSDQEISLPTAYVNGAQTWQVYDLDTTSGLYPGILYKLTGVQYALEDVNA